MVRVAHPMPAQLTSDLSGAISMAASTAAMTCSGFVTSVWTNSPPSSLARGSPLSAWRSATTTRTPRSAKRRDVASPSPEAPPVTIADVPFRSISLPLLEGRGVRGRGYGPDRSRSHLRRRLHAEEREPLLEHPRREVAEGEPGGAHGLVG